MSRDSFTPSLTHLTNIHIKHPLVAYLGLREHGGGEVEKKYAMCPDPTLVRREK